MPRKGLVGGVILVTVFATFSSACARLGDQGSREPRAGPSSTPTSSAHECSSPELRQDGSSLAKELRIPIGEACRYLELQDPIGGFGARIERQEADTFSGMHITYEPYGIVILGVTPRFDYEEHFSPELQELKDAIVYRQVEFTLDELSKAQAQASRAAPNIPFDSWLDIKTNKVFLRTESREDARRLEAVVREGTFAVSAETFVVEVGPLAQPGI